MIKLYKQISKINNKSLHKYLHLSGVEKIQISKRLNHQLKLEQELLEEEEVDQRYFTLH